MAASYTIGIVAHEKRRRLAEQLQPQVGAQVVSMDDNHKRLGCDNNHRATWKELTAHATEWLVVLEDDAQPVDDFNQQLTLALQAAPTHIVSLYLGRLRPSHWQQPIVTATQQADINGAHWITTNTAIHAVGIAVHHTLVDSLTQYGRKHLPIDQAITSWARTHQHTVAYTWPSLINHADQPTIIRQHQDGMPRPPGRTAWRTGTHQHWNSHTVWMPHPLHTRSKQAV